ncbi:PPE family protein, partial [Mycobacterium kansasii]
MNFSVLPPEINSVRIFAGAGPQPMLAAATAWDGLAGELAGAASSFSSVASGLVDGSWRGPASAAMAAAAAPYARWLSAAAGHASGAAAQARAVARAFDAARAATVHPLMVAINRNRFVQLVASNVLGLNAPAIASAEAQYEQMWAQDVVAMLGYHADTSAAAAALSPWGAGPQGNSAGSGQSGTSEMPASGRGPVASAISAGSSAAAGTNISLSNLGFGNTGNGNFGSGNAGDLNLGSGNNGNVNLGSG